MSKLQAGAFMPRSNDAISPRHVRDATDFSRCKPGDKSPGLEFGHI